MDFGKKVAFGFSGVVAGQKTNGNDKPQLIVNSTPGKFTLTSPVSKAMGVKVGEYLQFVHNINEIERAIQDQNEDIIAIAEELGVDLTTREGQLAVIDACTIWGIVKGQPMVDTKGNPIMVSMRMTIEEKENYVKENVEKVLAEVGAKIRERLGNPEATDEEVLAALQPDDVEYPKTPGFTGSKTSSTSNQTGVGLQLGFTDSAVWKQLKSGLDEEEAKKVNRVYAVDIENPVKTVVDGNELLVYPINFIEDKEITERIKK